MGGNMSSGTGSAPGSPARSEKGTAGAARVSVRCVSDVHVDLPENLSWLESLPEHPQDALIVAGDLSDELSMARNALRILKRKYGEVFCVPGNHDLWIQRSGRGDEENGIKDSMDKLHAFLAMCADEGVHTRPQCFGAEPDGTGGVCIVPLLSWHHQSFDTEPDVTGWQGIPQVEHCMVDYRRCAWPDPLRQEDDSVARAVDELNDRNESLPEGAGTETLPIVSFSHFLPRIELIPEKRYLFLPTLAKAVGSRFLGERVQRLSASVHVFGHTHFGWDASLEGTRYIQAALGYPEEWASRPDSMDIGELRYEPVLVWDSVDGFAPHHPARWSGFYETNSRQPELKNMLAPYVAKRYRKLPEGEICDWPMGPPDNSR